MTLNCLWDTAHKDLCMCEHVHSIRTHKTKVCFKFPVETQLCLRSADRFASVSGLGWSGWTGFNPQQCWDVKNHFNDENRRNANIRKNRRKRYNCFAKSAVKIHNKFVFVVQHVCIAVKVCRCLTVSSLSPQLHLTQLLWSWETGKKRWSRRLQQETEQVFQLAVLLQERINKHATLTINKSWWPGTFHYKNPQGVYSAFSLLRSILA